MRSDWEPQNFPQNHQVVQQKHPHTIHVWYIYLHYTYIWVIFYGFSCIGKLHTLSSHGWAIGTSKAAQPFPNRGGLGLGGTFERLQERQWLLFVAFDLSLCPLGPPGFFRNKKKRYFFNNGKKRMLGGLLKIIFLFNYCESSLFKDQIHDVVVFFWGVKCKYSI